MRFPAPPLTALSLALTSLAPRGRAEPIDVTVTPHASYSSSVGVLGCKINTNRVAYWPMAVDCRDICVKLSYGGRSVHLLRIDQSAGAYDVSYDAWNYLQTGESARDAPLAGGGVAMTYETVAAAECADLLDDGGLALSATNSMNYLFSCLADEDSWVAQNYVLFNIADSLCSVGFDEECDLDWKAGANMATCAHGLGSPAVLTSEPVYNIMYPTGEEVLATTGEARSGASPVFGGVRTLSIVFASMAVHFMVAQL